MDKDGLYKQVDCLVLNPKSITAGELYGEFHTQTNEWKVRTYINELFVMDIGFVFLFLFLFLCLLFYRVGFYYGLPIFW